MGYNTADNDQLPFEVVTYDFAKDNQIILYAAFAEDFDPKLILVVSYNPEKNKSYINILQTKKKLHLLSYTFREEDQKQDLIG